MPVFVAGTHHESGKGDRPADQTVVDRFAGGLEARAEKGVGGAADGEFALFGLGHDGFAVVAGDGRGFFEVDVLSVL